MWEKATDLIFTGVVHLKGDSLKHFWIMDRSLCGIEAEEFRVAEDAIVTCPHCREEQGFFEMPHSPNEVALTVPKWENCTLSLKHLSDKSLAFYFAVDNSFAISEPTLVIIHW
ncbi:hypothetical protein [Kamptonema sp. UHCC 0994]|uniref:hypothetical protein n=1 Tax=Kamptonema sp. UHCC 0994 TaxID=3031329 RepID=UPI0023BA5543|nr:hypothetical protein [Kamptonema sp. UHCC 0994]MDF0556416.1 hypothetical protein [Kamptonema sp. UHCC 0994]